MNVNFDYEIGQEVKVIAIAMTGRVDSLSLDRNGKMYRVVYWNDGARCQSWMYEWEIMPIKTSINNTPTRATDSQQ